MSVVRFGDGELSLMSGQGIGYQVFDSALSDELIGIAARRNDKLMICVPDVFTDLSGYAGHARAFWQESLSEHRHEWLAFFEVDRIYGNTLLSRPYIDFCDRAQSARCFDRAKTLWANRPVVMVEGRMTRFGIGNDLLAGAESVRRVICPERNAYRHYSEILDTVSRSSDDALILIALGPAAKPLVVDLFDRGFQAIDIGHLDIEYEWFLRKATHKIAIPGKYVNEIDPTNGGFVEYEATNGMNTDDYWRQIAERVGEAH
jgi:glycosyltransferase family protein